MSNLTAQQHYENTRGSNSRENVEKRNLKAFGHKPSKAKALKKAKKHIGHTGHDPRFSIKRDFDGKKIANEGSTYDQFN